MPRFAALDTKFLLALAGGESDTEGTIDYLHRTGFYPIATESVIEQLGDLLDNGSAETKPLAEYAAKWMVSWGVLTPECPLCQNGTSQVQAERIMEENLIPGGTLLEAEILVEASCHGCDLLVTFSTPLLEADSSVLNLALIENHLEKVVVTIASPEVIARRLTQLPAPQAAAHR